MRSGFRLFLFASTFTFVTACGDDNKKSTTSATQIPRACPTNDINDVIAAKPKPRPPLPQRVTLSSVTPDRGGEGTQVTLTGPDFGSPNRPVRYTSAAPRRPSILGRRRAS